LFRTPLHTLPDLVKYTHMKRKEIITILQNGISEVTYTDEHSVEHSIMATLAPIHLPDEEQSATDSFGGHSESEYQLKKHLYISVFNVNSEEWQLISIHNVIDVEQLTGHGAESNQNKLQAGDEYMKQLELFGDDDEDEVEPTDTDMEGYSGSVE